MLDFVSGGKLNLAKLVEVLSGEGAEEARTLWIGEGLLHKADLATGKRNISVISGCIDRGPIDLEKAIEIEAHAD